MGLRSQPHDFQPDPLVSVTRDDQQEGDDHAGRKARRACDHCCSQPCAGGCLSGLGASHSRRSDLLGLFEVLDASVEITLRYGSQSPNVAHRVRASRWPAARDTLNARVPLTPARNLKDFATAEYSPGSRSADPSPDPRPDLDVQPPHWKQKTRRFQRVSRSG